MKKKKDKLKKVRNRVSGLEYIKVKNLKDNPENWRVHNEKQREALRAVLEDVGIAGVQIGRRLKDGSVMLLDGHLRRSEYPPEMKVPVIILDVNEEEARKILLSHDPLSAMATTDPDKLGFLLKSVRVDSVPLANMFSDLAESAKTKLKNLNLDIGDGETAAEKPLENLPESHVRMINLFLDTTTLPKFERMIDRLAKRYKMNNVTDIVMKALSKASKKNVKIN